jgi:hypothetical protein
MACVAGTSGAVACLGLDRFRSAVGLTSAPRRATEFDGLAEKGERRQIASEGHDLDRDICYWQSLVGDYGKTPEAQAPAGPIGAGAPRTHAASPDRRGLGGTGEGIVDD